MSSYIWNEWDQLMWWNVERIEDRAYHSYEVERIESRAYYSYEVF